MLTSLHFLLAACTTRPLLPEEIALLAPIHGATLDPTRIRLTELPLVGVFPITFDARPPVTCRERIAPPQVGRVETRAAGIAVLNRLLISPSVGLGRFASGREAPLALADAMFLAHEATHVWQWQNRSVTGFTPLRAFAEQVSEDDPYLFALDDRPFLARGFEEQASLVEEYLCCATLDPDGARTARLRSLLSQALPVAPPDAFARPVTLPWPRADLTAICG